MRPSVSSLYKAVELRQEIAPLLIGERVNPNGSKKFRELLLADDFDGCLRVGLEQEERGAHVLDVCVAYAGRDELADLTKLVGMFAQSVKTPIMIDSTSPDSIEACLKIYPGRCIINSVNLEDGGKNLHRVCAMAKRYGAAVVALTINEQGMAMTAQDKVDTAKRIYAVAVDEHGLRPQDLLFDALTFTVGAGDETLRDAAIQTLEALKTIKADLPGVGTILGVSNISFGMRPGARKVLTSVFLHEAVEAGLDAAIVDVAKVVPLAGIDAKERTLSLDLLYDRQQDPEKTPLMAFIDHFETQQSESEDETEKDDSKASEQVLHKKVVAGDKEGLEDLLTILLERYTPVNIINQILVPGMRHVGELFGKGELLLPFVLQSAEVMKKSVSFLEPFMDKSEEQASVKILLATVQGDVHDIGKNLVDIILSNNGYKVFNIGTKVPAEVIIEKAREHHVDIIGLSGLLVKSAIIMQESMAQYAEAELKQPILLGGAALTTKFVAQSCVPSYDAPVVYCADAFAGLKAVREFEGGTLKSTEYTEAPPRPQTADVAPDIEVDRSLPAPSPPFTGVRYATDIDAPLLFPYVNKQALFRGRWGYRRGKASLEEYTELVETKVEPLYEELMRRSVDEDLVKPKVAYGYFPCVSEDNRLLVEHEGKTEPFDFPRQSQGPHQCIADFFKTEAEGGDIVGLFVATIGPEIGEASRALFEKDAYHDYLMLHGFSVEVTDALAEYWHEVMRQELAIGKEKPGDAVGYITQGYQGSRYGFGYPSCPDLEAHRPVFRLLEPGRIGVELTENMEMVPEQSTSALVAHHPQAKYFAV